MMSQDTVLLEQIHAFIRNHFFSAHNFIHFLHQHFPDLGGSAMQAGVGEAALRKYEPANLQEGTQATVTRSFDTEPVLTKREREVLGLLEQGLCAKEIAQALFISETTVITHKKNLKNKFKVKNTVELVSRVYSLSKSSSAG